MKEVKNEPRISQIEMLLLNFFDLFFEFVRYLKSMTVKQTKKFLLKKRKHGIETLRRR